MQLEVIRERCTPVVPDDVREEVKQRLLSLIVFKAIE